MYIFVYDNAGILKMRQHIDAEDNIPLKDIYKQMILVEEAMERGEHDHIDFRDSTRTTGEKETLDKFLARVLKNKE